MKRVILFSAVLCFGCDSVAVESRGSGTLPPVVASVSPPPQPKRQESCNGIDDDGDNKIDEGCPIRITTDPGDDIEVEIDGARIAWLRVSGGEGAVGSVVVRDLPVGPERIVGMNAQYPQVSGNRVAWLSAQHHFVFDLGTDMVSDYQAPPAAVVQRCALGGDWLGWSQLPDGASDVSDVYTRNLTSGAVVKRTNSQGADGYPRFSGNYMVWSDTLGSGATPNCELTVLDLDSDMTHPILPMSQTSTCTGGPPVLGNGLAVLLDVPKDPTQCQVATYNVASDGRTPVGPAGRCEYPLAVGKRFVIGTAGGSSTQNLDLLDVDTGKWWALTTYPGIQNGARLSDDTVIWSDNRHGSFNLYMIDLSDFSEGDFFPEGLPPS